jgi:hypothetical protein
MNLSRRLNWLWAEREPPSLNSAQDVVDESGQKEADSERNNQREVVHGRPCPREGFLRLFFGGFLVFFLAM